MTLDVDRSLRRLSAVAAIGLCLALVITLVWLLWPPARDYLTSTAPTSGYTVGQTVDLPPSIYKEGRMTVIIFGRSSCIACESSRPVLTHLVASVQALPEVRVRLLTPIEPTSGDLLFAKQIGLTADAVSGILPSSVRVLLIPTVLTATPDGVIRFAASGPFTSDNEVALRQVLGNY